MPSRRTLERLTLVVLALALIWQTWSLQHARANLQRAVVRADALAEQKRASQEAVARLPRPPLPSQLFRAAPTPPPAALLPGLEADEGVGIPPEAAAKVARAIAVQAQRRERQGRGGGGEEVLNRLYDAADELAASEQWTPETYDEVVSIFDETSLKLQKLMEGVKARKVPPRAARVEALNLRDEAQDRIADIVGPRSLERLKHIMEDQE